MEQLKQKLKLTRGVAKITANFCTLLEEEKLEEAEQLIIQYKEKFTEAQLEELRNFFNVMVEELEKKTYAGSYSKRTSEEKINEMREKYHKFRDKPLSE